MAQKALPVPTKSIDKFEGISLGGDKSVKVCQMLEFDERGEQVLITHKKA